jgi:hypothetical protein
MKFEGKAASVGNEITTSSEEVQEALLIVHLKV